MDLDLLDREVPGLVDLDLRTPLLEERLDLDLLARKLTGLGEGLLDGDLLVLLVEDTGRGHADLDLLATPMFKH